MSEPDPAADKEDLLRLLGELHSGGEANVDDLAARLKLSHDRVCELVALALGRRQIESRWDLRYRLKGEPPDQGGQTS